MFYNFILRYSVLVLIHIIRIKRNKTQNRLSRFMFKTNTNKNGIKFQTKFCLCDNESLFIKF